MEKPFNLPQGFDSYLQFYDYIKREDPKIIEGDNSSLVTYFWKGNRTVFKLGELKCRCFDEMVKNRPHIKDVQRIEHYYFESMPPVSITPVEESKIFKRLFDLSVK